jgi:tRNA A22 N-methylase
MTQLTLDAATIAKMGGLSQFLTFIDEQGNILGHFEPSEHSPAHRDWLHNLQPSISEEEMQKREQNLSGISTEQLVEKLRARS